MTASVALINTAADTWQVVIDRVNTLANLASNAMVTVSATAAGSVSTGNGVVNGIFVANTFGVVNSIRGGNTSVSQQLNVSSNVSIGGAVFLYTTGAITGTSLGLGANVTLTTTGASYGNSTVNVQVNSTAIVIGGSNAATIANRTAVVNSTAGVFLNQKLNVIAGANLAVTVTNDVVGNQVNVKIDALTQATPLGGSNTYVQFNDSGALGGSLGLVFDKTSNNVTVANNVSAAGVNLDSGSCTQKHINVATSGTTAQLVDSWAGGTYRSAFYSVSVKNGSANGYYATQLTLMYDDTDTHLLEFGSIVSNTALGTFAANASAGTVRLYFTPTPAACNVRAYRVLLTI